MSGTVMKPSKSVERRLMTNLTAARAASNPTDIEDRD